MLVLEDHGYGDLLGRYALLWYTRFHALSSLDPVGRIGLAAIDEEEIFLDESLDEAAADPEPSGGQPVDALPGLCRVYSETLYGAPSLVWTTKPSLTPAQKAVGPDNAAVCVLAVLIEELL
jgi:hypothetical protein